MQCLLQVDPDGTGAVVNRIEKDAGVSGGKYMQVSR